MAEKDTKPSGGSSGGNSFFDLFGDDILTWLAGLIVFGLLLSALLVPLQARFGTLSPSSILAHYILSDDTPLGSEVRARDEALVWNEAGGTNLLGTQRMGALGTLVGGPITIDGERWWDIDFEAQPDGWVRESDIELVTFFSTTWKWIRWLSAVLSLLFLTGIIYSVWRINEIRMEERLALKMPGEGALAVSSERNERWERVEALAVSDNPSDWRAAIIEADVMLDELVTAMGYGGEGLGDKLKGIEESDFISLNEAWEVHKVRNRIAHEGGDFILTQRETRRVVALFEKVFREFDII